MCLGGVGGGGGGDTDGRLWRRGLYPAAARARAITDIEKSGARGWIVVEAGAVAAAVMSAAEPWIFRWSVINARACPSSSVTQFPSIQSWRHIFSLFRLPYKIGSDLALHELQHSEIGRAFERHDGGWWSVLTALFMLPC